jgi:hypothetical protein
VITHTDPSRLLAADLRNFESAARLNVCDAPPVFRLRIECPDPGDAAGLLTFLRRDGIFAFPVTDGIQAVTVDDPRLDAPRELIGRIADWLSGGNDPAINVSLA